MREGCQRKRNHRFRKFFIVSVVFFLCVFQLINIQRSSSTLTDKIVVHRGALIGSIPNTREAINNTLKLIPEANIEIDVQETNDGMLILLHDATLNSETSAKGNVIDKTWEELQQHFRRDARGKITNVSITRLCEIMALLKKYPKAELQIDSKLKSSSGYDTLAFIVLSDPDIAKRIIITSGDLNVLRMVHEKYPSLRLGWDPGELIKDGFNISTVNEIITQAKTIDAEVIYLDYGLVRGNNAAIVIREFHDAGIAVDVWTIDDPFKICQFIRWGADKITTNRADVFYNIVLLCPS